MKNYLSVSARSLVRPLLPAVLAAALLSCDLSHSGGITAPPERLNGMVDPCAIYNGPNNPTLFTNDDAYYLCWQMMSDDMYVNCPDLADAGLETLDQQVARPVSAAEMFQTISAAGGLGECGGFQCANVPAAVINGALLINIESTLYGGDFVATMRHELGHILHLPATYAGPAHQDLEDWAANDYTQCTAPPP